VLKLSPKRLILCHTRAPTEGSSLDARNNHPFEFDDLYLAHNGLIFNHEQLREDFGITVDIETDSIVILALVHFAGRAAGDMAFGIQMAAKVLRGSYACWLLDRRHNELFLFRCISPLYVRDQYSTLVFSSEPFEGSRMLREGTILKLDLTHFLLQNAGQFAYYTPFWVPTADGQH